MKVDKLKMLLQLVIPAKAGGQHLATCRLVRMATLVGISLAILIAFFAFIACTDYVQQIDDRYGEWIEYGKLTDARDGKTYKTVEIGSQVWMAANLNYKMDSSYCYEDDANNCDKYGRLYTWSAALKVCPSGWHLPSKTEWETLNDAAGGLSIAGRELKSRSGWKDGGNGNDAFGFSALPAGYDGFFKDDHVDNGFYARFWSSTEIDEDIAFARIFAYDVDFGSEGLLGKKSWLSVRCLKDDEKTTGSSSSTAQSSSSQKTNTSSSETIKSSSSQKIASSSSSKVSKPAEETSSSSVIIEYGELTDSRDGQTYKTVTIGSQVWTAENLNFKADFSFCYKNEESNCFEYGRLYTWDAAATVCPSGWHLPSNDEWETLFTAVAVGGSLTAGNVLKSQIGWYSSGNGTDDFGFTALPAGYRLNDGYFYNKGYLAYFWSSTELSSTFAYYMFLYYDYGKVNLYNYNKDYAFSVRCIQD